jgi:hypothetical protein
MFAGLTSRCTRPSPCALSSASPTLDVLHGEEEHVALLARRVDRDDVRVLEARGQLRLEQEAPTEAVVVGELVRQHLDRGFALQVDVLGEIDGAHGASAEKSLHAKARERRANRKVDVHREGIPRLRAAA